MANTAKSDAYKKKSALQETRHTKARAEQLHEWRLMNEMGKALGLEVPKPITNNPLDKHTNTRIALTPGLTVTLSVRRGLFDVPFLFTHTSKSFIKDMAVMEAEKAARSQGLEVRFLIGATNEDGRDISEVPQNHHISIAERALAQARARL